VKQKELQEEAKRKKDEQRLKQLGVNLEPFLNGEVPDATPDEQKKIVAEFGQAVLAIDDALHNLAAGNKIKAANAAYAKARSVIRIVEDDVSRRRESRAYYETNAPVILPKA
jgi:hypothetical protein